MAAIIVFIFIIYAYTTSKSIKNLEEENRKLKKKLQEANFSSEDEIKQKSFIPEEKIQKNSIPKNNISTNETENIKKEEVSVFKKNEKNEREKKNISILVAGSILIILSAIVFLMSTWLFIPNVLKIIIMILLVGVFLGASRIAKNKFRLEKTSMTFFYIAMAYIPICLIACSIFGLFGEFLSIRGEGKYAYLAISIFITSLIYYLYYKNNKSKILLLGTVLAQMLAISLFTLIFEEKIILILINLLIYNIILTIVCKRNEVFKELLNKIYINIPYIIGFISLFYLLFSDLYMIILLPLLAINFYITQSSYNKIINCYLTNISVYILGFYIAFILDIDISKNLKIIFSLIYLICASSLNILFIQNENMNKASRMISLISGGLIFFQCVIYYKNTFIKPYMVSIIELILLIACFVISKDKEKKVYSYLIPIVGSITGINILKILDAKYYWYIILSIIIYMIGQLIKNKSLNKSFFVVSNIFLIISYLDGLNIKTQEILSNIIIHLVILVVYIYSFIKYKEYKFLKYLIYISFGLLLISVTNFFKISEIAYFVPAVLEIIILLIENRYKNINDKYIDWFNTILQIISYITIIYSNYIAKILILFLYSIYLVFDNLKNNKNEYFRLIPILGLIIGLNTNIPIVFENYSILIILLSTILLTLISIYKGKVHIDTIFSGIYLINLLTFFESDIIKYIFLTIWSLVNVYFMKTEKSKDVFRVISYISIFLLYTSFIEVLNLNEYVSFTMIGTTILTIVLIKNIMKHYAKDTDIAEYTILALIYLISLVSYINEKDGIIYGLFLVILLIYSYMKKYGAVFIITLVGIVINAILLTRVFWLLIPWWIYLLIIGSVLIAFAIKNESDENKIDTKNVIKNLKDKIEK